MDPQVLAGFAAICGYLLGSIPWGLVLTRMAGLGDIREIGSGNIGATNVLRTGNKFLAFLTLVLDASKGAVAALIFMQMGELAGIVAAFAAVLGHNFPVWLKFKGGKGVATTLGALIAVSWPVGILTCCVWLLVAGAFKYSSLASILSILASPVIADPRPQYCADFSRNMCCCARRFIVATTLAPANRRLLLSTTAPGRIVNPS